MALLMLLGYLVCSVLLAWAMLQQPSYLSPYHHPHHEIQINGYIRLFSNHSQKSN